MALVFTWDSKFDEPAVGDEVVISDTTASTIRPYVSGTDDPSLIIGLVYPKTGRVLSQFNGPIYALYGPWVVNEDLSLPVDDFGANISNPLERTIDPFNDASLSIVIPTGQMGVVKSTSETPFTLLHSGTNYNWVLLV